MPDVWKVLKRENILDCPPWLNVVRETIQLEDGYTVIDDFYRVDMPDFAMIFALTPDRKIPLVEQYKHAAGKRILELPAGYLEPGENALDAAKRELLEECGMRASEWRRIGSFVKDGNKGCGSCYAFLALDAETVAAPSSGDLQSQIVHHMTPRQVIDLWLSGEIVEMSSTGVIGLGLALIGETVR